MPAALLAQTPAKQSAWSSVRTDWLWAPVSPLSPLQGAEQVLDVVAVLVGDHVALGERPALGAEPRPQLVEEAEVEVDELVGRAVERARVAARGAAAALGRIGEEDRVDRLVRSRPRSANSLVQYAWTLLT